MPGLPLHRGQLGPVLMQGRREVQAREIRAELASRPRRGSSFAVARKLHSLQVDEPRQFAEPAVGNSERTGLCHSTMHEHRDGEQGPQLPWTRMQTCQRPRQRQGTQPDLAAREL